MKHSETIDGIAGDDRRAPRTGRRSAGAGAVRAGSFVALGAAALVAFVAPIAAGAAPFANLPAGLPLDAPVEVIHDRRGVPHIYGQSIEDVHAVLGALHVRDRLWQMELQRRIASGTLAEVAGEGAFEQDRLMRALGIRRTCEEALRSGLLGPQVESSLLAYAEGVNAALAAIPDERLPSQFRALGIRPAPWTPVDSLAWTKYMGWDQSGSDTDLWLGEMVERLGADTVEELWPMERPYERAAIPNWRASGVPEGMSIDGDRAAARGGMDVLDGVAEARSTTSVQSIASIQSTASTTALGPAFRALGERLRAAGLLRVERSFGSNNWVVAGSRTVSGRPILANDPHLGLRIPSIWYAAHMVAPGMNVSGVTFAGSPFVVIGANDRIAWGLTNMQADAVDYFVETVDPENPARYLHRGRSKEFVERVEEIRVLGEAEPRKVVVRSTVHGPVEEVAGRRLSMQWTGLGVTLELRAIAGLNFARGLKDFLEAIRFLDIPAMNLVFADVEGNIALAPHGDLPVRGRGRGRVPADGASGEFDWTGFIPRDRLPLSINPPQGFLASANGRPVGGGYPYDLGALWDPSYRYRRIHDMLSKAERIAPEDMIRFQLDAYDKCAEEFVPVLLRAIEGAPAPESDPGGASSARARAIEVLRAWNFECLPDHPAPTIFAAWFNLFRESVWNDEWKARGFEMPGGSWGFSGDNRREPALEVLERMTREQPDSVWFDDRATSARETRDDILLRSFDLAMERLRAAHGDDPTAWRWGAVNRLRLRPMSPDPAFARGGMELASGPFTVNPGGDGGDVTAGASWRMIAALGSPAKVFGAYPGGQSEDPSSPAYDDWVQPWAIGGYHAIPMHARPEDFAEGEAVQRERVAAN